MRAMIRGAAALAAVSGAVCNPATAGPPPTRLTTAAQVGVQARTYPISANLAFNAALSALQKQGYVDINANRDAGTISAFADGKSKTILNFFWGFGKKKWTQKAAILVEEDGAGSTVRLNLLAGETKARQNWGFWAGGFSDAQIITVPDPYIDFFHLLDAEIARRGGSASSVSVRPDATGRIDLGGVRLKPANTASGYCIDAPANYEGTGAGNSPAVTSARPLCG